MIFALSGGKTRSDPVFVLIITASVREYLFATTVKICCQCFKNVLSEYIEPAYRSEVFINYQGRPKTCFQGGEG